MAEENSKSPHSQAQQIPLAKIHDLPGVFVGKQPDKSYGGLVTSIQAGGVKEPVVLRLREDGEYQLVTGYRRRRASELAKKQDIPALVYEMSMQEAQDYHHRVKNQPDMAIPGKLLPPPDKGQTTDLKGPEKPTTDPKAPDKPSAPKTPDKPAAPAAGDKSKGQEKPAEGVKAPADAAPEKGQPAAPKPSDKAAAPAAGDKAKGQEKPAESVKAPADAKELDVLFEKLYEDNVNQKISDARFAKMSQRYEAEQGENAKKIKALRLELKKSEGRRMDVDTFLETVRRYTNATEITQRMVAELIDHIDVYHAEKKDGVTTQHITIYYNCIGAFSVPDRRKIPAGEITMGTRKGVAVSYSPEQIA